MRGHLIQREAASFLFWGVPFVLSCSFVSHTKRDDTELCHYHVSPPDRGRDLRNWRACAGPSRGLAGSAQEAWTVWARGVLAGIGKVGCSEEAEPRDLHWCRPLWVIQTRYMCLHNVGS